MLKEVLRVNYKGSPSGSVRTPSFILQRQTTNKWNEVNEPANNDKDEIITCHSSLIKSPYAFSLVFIGLGCTATWLILEVEEQGKF